MLVGMIGYPCCYKPGINILFNCYYIATFMIKIFYGHDVLDLIENVTIMPWHDQFQNVLISNGNQFQFND